MYSGDHRYIIHDIPLEAKLRFLKNRLRYTDYRREEGGHKHARSFSFCSLFLLLFLYFSLLMVTFYLFFFFVKFCRFRDHFLRIHCSLCYFLCCSFMRHIFGICFVYFDFHSSKFWSTMFMFSMHFGIFLAVAGIFGQIFRSCSISDGNLSVENS